MAPKKSPLSKKPASAPARSASIETISVSLLLPYPGNARTHSENQVKKIAASIKEFGFNNPVLIDDENRVIAGHGRIEAAKLLGLKEIPCLVLSHLTDAQRRAYILADNRMALDAGWDNEILEAEMRRLIEDGFDLELTGFDEKELEALLKDKTEGMTEEDDAPAVPLAPVSRPGDVWVLGKHRFMCGDSTSADDVAKLLGGVSPHLMVTDPPYGVDYDATWRNDAAEKGLIGQKKPTKAIGKVKNDDNADWREAWALFPGNIAYIWHDGTMAGPVQESIEACGFKVRAQIIWAKNNFAISRGDYHWKHEPCLYAVKGKGLWKGDRSQTTLWEIDKPMKSETGHSTQKPVECMRRPILNNSSPGQAVYDPFLGSGTTMIAAETEGRACIGMEINPEYVDIAVLRWMNFTGNAAILESTGEPFVASGGLKEVEDG